MSGGYFDYSQWRITEIADKIEHIVEKETAPRPPVVKKKELIAWAWYGNRGSSHPTLTTSIEREHQRYKLHEDVREITDIVTDGIRRSFTATDYNDFRYEVIEWESEHYYDKDGGEIWYADYSSETIEEFKKAVNIIRQAAVYAQRIDWLLSGDDGEDTFHKRLQEELSKLNNKDMSINKKIK